VTGPGPVAGRSSTAAGRWPTPARVFLGGAGTALRTRDLLELRAGHAAARDAVRARFDDQVLALAPFVADHGMFTVGTRGDSSETYLRRPDLGRRFDDESAAMIRAEGTHGSTVQIVVCDGLSARAMGAHAPKFVARFAELSQSLGWLLGRLFAVRHARVGLMNEVGELLRPEVVLLLIGERPGLDSQSSMSAYIGYQPGRTHTDADRSLISNIHDDGIPPEQAAEEAVALIERFRACGASGVSAILSDYRRGHLTQP
jgi:ethanolamine ammonia-lyase small subunit